jgi:hypothetical protein
VRARLALRSISSGVAGSGGEDARRRVIAL